MEINGRLTCLESMESNTFDELFSTNKNILEQVFYFDLQPAFDR